MTLSTPDLSIQFDEPSHTYLVNGEVFPSVTHILRAVGLSTDWTRLPPLVRAAAELKRDLGVRVHEACRLHDRGELSWGTLADDLFPYVEAWERYCKARGILDFDAIEQIVAHPTLRYAGTLDRIATLATNEPPLLVDLKCGDPDDAAGQFQTAGYAGTFLDRSFVRECVRLFPTGKFSVFPYPHHRDDWKVFQAALTVYRAQPSRR